MITSMILANEHGVVIGWSPEARKMFGYTAKEAVGRSVDELIVPERYHKAHMAGFAKFRKTHKVRLVAAEVAAKHKDGHEFPVSITLGASSDGVNVVLAAIQAL